MLRYKSFPILYRAISWLIKHSPLPDWIAVKTKYGLMIVPKSFRILTVKFDLVETEIKKRLEDSLKNADIFIDVGAAYGYYTLKASRLIGKRGLILAFEPDPVMYRVLKANLTINNVNNVKSFQEALGDFNGETTISGKRIKISKLDKVVKWIHLPVQSGDNEILKKMNRGYTRERYLELVKKIRQKIPKVILTTDIIVGFPQETEKQFQNTVDLVKKCRFDQAFIAKFSPRPNTLAADLDDNVPLKEKKRRFEILVAGITW